MVWKPVRWKYRHSSQGSLKESVKTVHPLVHSNCVCPLSYPRVGRKKGNRFNKVEQPRSAPSSYNPLPFVGACECPCVVKKKNKKSLMSMQHDACGVAYVFTAKLKVIATGLPQISSYNTCLTQAKTKAKAGHRSGREDKEISDTCATLNFNFIGFYPTGPHTTERERDWKILKSPQTATNSS